MGPPSPGKVLRGKLNNERLMGRGRAEGKGGKGKRHSLAALIQGEEVIKQFLHPPPRPHQGRGSGSCLPSLAGSRNYFLAKWHRLAPSELGFMRGGVLRNGAPLSTQQFLLMEGNNVAAGATAQGG